ncbi:MAG: hypothetical protein OQL06_11040 [Gammaproteobacteria bacterium]|nr:hypothetical protein [Gammaproteobacteria bacterium]
MKSPFSSTALFREEFNKGLHVLTDQGGLGPFILACANATVHEELFADLKEKLENQYQEIYEQYRSAFCKGRDVAVVDEDLLVFLKIHAIGFESIQPAQERYEGEWKIQFNHLRSFRPRRMTRFVHEGISIPYNEDRFNFNKPFMQQECFWSGELAGRQADLFYNKYPFADLHGLLVLDPEKCFPQLLGYEHHQYVHELCKILDITIPGVGFGYNSYGAYASVNHLHFQMFVDEVRLPVDQNCWQHNGGGREYPAECHVFDSAGSSWKYIRDLHDKKQPYNILYMPGKVYVFPRKTQGAVEVPEWSSGFTWYELAGGMITFNYDDYKQLTVSAIENHLKQLRVLV